ncbi:ArsB/NhaD family transporter [Streptomyces lunaelactis]|uniref:SLC13 family permease n=1 Tax=Streptomyces lunaelactis TaxID=1535768 RepID=UPI001584C1E9|nr:ArsB/NhaD family transporter [Streptomyces lunaelactis]NUK00032.1 ArsB/NhaD family transporter [Streptomyces lunaelactis]NUK06994.1 ArsB/NhaD family transporter [Streptomyces lunaelactis]NUK14356.1 ArsB/NhaD family transporter [Streptomyces lunaelactis]NUK32710.1 ArsB/NhaD family transporter [Streptomyces lunaelactis]NUK39541.1 ArsB/NhaD family transporter [Streptomyces lunaelactis]
MNDWHSWAAIAVFVGTYALIISERIHRVAAALGGAGLMLAIGATDDVSAFYLQDRGIDWNVIFLLLGMMMIVGVLKKTGMFEYLAIWAVKRAKAKPFRVMVMLIVITAVASALLDNVTTVLLIAPVTLLVCERLALPVAPFLIAEVFASNIGGTATLVGDPPNIIIASRAGLTFNDFLIHLAPLSALLTVVLVALCRFMFRKSFVYDEDRAAEIMELEEREAIRDPRLLVQGLAVLVLVVAGFVLHPVLHYEPSVVALLGAGLLIAVSTVETNEVLAEVEWPTLAFFAGLFVMIGGLIDTGVIGEVADSLAGAIGDRELGGSMLMLGASAVLSGVVDNIPYVATMAPITGDLVKSLGGGADHVMWWALALGADLGGNATAIGASANVVVLGIAERNRTPITFWQFTKYGLVVTAVTIGLSALYIWLRYFALA